MKQPIIHQHLGRHKNSCAHHLAAHGQLQGVAGFLFGLPHLFHGLAGFLSFFFLYVRIVCNLGVLLFICRLGFQVFHRAGHKAIVLESLAAEHGQHLHQLIRIPLERRLLAHREIRLCAVVRFGHFGHYRIPPGIRPMGIRRESQFFQMMVYKILAAFPKGHPGFHVHVFQPVGAGQTAQKLLHLSFPPPGGVQLCGGAGGQSRFQLPISMVTHLLADGFFVFRAGGEHFAVSVPRRVPSQFRGRGRHARNLPQCHARVQRQDGASIPAADPCKKAENVLSSSGLLLQVCQIVFHEFNAFFTKVFPHRRPQTSILLPVGVPNFVGVADRRGQAAIGCRIR